MTVRYLWGKKSYHNVNLVVDFSVYYVIIIYSSFDILWGDRLIAEYSEFDLIPSICAPLVYSGKTTTCTSILVKPRSD